MKKSDNPDKKEVFPKDKFVYIDDLSKYPELFEVDSEENEEIPTDDFPIWKPRTSEDDSIEEENE